MKFTCCMHISLKGTEPLVLEKYFLCLIFEYNLLGKQGINVVRDNRAAAVNTDGFQALTTHAAVSSLLDSLLREGEIQSPQISNFTSNNSLIENTADFSDQTMQLESNNRSKLWFHVSIVA